MAERYKRLYTLEGERYTKGSPVIIAAGALLCDNNTGGVLAQVKYRNLTTKIISGMTVLVTSIDNADRELEEKVEYKYLDLSEQFGNEFGSKSAIVLPDNTARKFDITVTEIVFSDKSIWSNDKPFEPIKTSSTLLSLFKDNELVKQYMIETDSSGENIPESYKDLFLCSCGEVYKNSLSACPKCGLDRQNSIDKLNEQELRKKADERIKLEKETAEAERLQREKREAEERAEAERTKRRTKKILEITLPAAVLIIVALIIYNSIIIPNMNYNKAEELVAEEKYIEALSMYRQLDDYKDSKEKAEDLMYQLNYNMVISASRITVGLKKDGTVIAIGDNYRGICNVDDWTDIVAVSTGDLHTVGLKKDGTVVATGYNKSGQCNVGDWTDIVAVSAGDSHTVGLKKDGTIVATGYNEYGQCNVGEWTDIVAVSAGSYHTVGLKKDGTVVATGANDYGRCDVGDWRDIVAVSAGSSHTVGLKKDGTVIAIGSNYYHQCDVGEWTDIVAVSAGDINTVGLKKDGTVIATGYNEYGQCNVENWTDIVAVFGGSSPTVASHTVGLKKDGTVVATGYNGSGQCDVADWTDIKVPQSN